MLDALRELFTRRQSTNEVTAQGAPDLGIALLAPGINAIPAQVATTQTVPEPQPAEPIAETPAVVILPEPAELAESEEAWNKRVRMENGMPAEQRVAL